MKLSIKQIYTVGAALLVALGGMTVLAAMRSHHSSTVADETAARRYQSYLLADELRQSSDDLTRLARTFVATGDDKWERQYFEILDIRNGKLPRPQAYQRIYWDFRAAEVQEVRPGGESVALLELMKRTGFADNELAKLAEAKANSDDLVRTETIAMNMVKGLYEDGKGGFTRRAEPDRGQALAMLHDLTYHRYKAKIMKPVDEFLVLLDERTAHELQDAIAARQHWLVLTMTALVLLVAVVLGGLIYLRRRTQSVVGEVARVAAGIAAGRLDQPIDTEAPGEEGEALRRLSQMQQRLAELVGTIRHSAENVATASEQIRQGNEDLSLRTERQASALQETAATMEQLGATVASNAEGAQRAHHLVRGSTEVATQGQQVMGEVVSTMQGISDSSQRIGHIISVIDGIAFQTNILALNAAVEAARAGEQGRGFAVVAGEVRGLARRCADAAKEIKGLIGGSVERIERGAALVDKAGQTMNEIVASIQGVREIVALIATASAEQSHAVQQVGGAVVQMDRSTQQNAALVQEGTSAAESLQQQSTELVASVAVFQLPGPRAR